MDKPEAASANAPDEGLLKAFLAGEDEAFAALVERHSRDLYVFIGRFTRSPAAADDIVQETFVQVYQSAAGFDQSRKFRPWLYTIAANKARDHLRERTRKREVPLDGLSTDHSTGEATYLDFLSDDADLPADTLEAAELRDAVRTIISTMPPHLREILVLGYYQRLPYKEIAEILSIPLGTVKSRLHAAVAYFAEVYKKAESARGSQAR